MSGGGRRVASAGSGVLRVVLDTNIVLSALVFAGGRVARIRTAWQVGHCVPLASSVTVRELVRVLAYPKFRLDAASQRELLADFLPYAEVVRIPDPPPAVPSCRDRFDLPFLHLAAVGGADALVTGDADLLVLEAVGPCPILTLDAFSNRLPASA